MKTGTICSKHDKIADFASHILGLVDECMEDGRKMEDGLKAKRDRIDALEEELREAVEEIGRLQEHLKEAEQEIRSLNRELVASR